VKDTGVEYLQFRLIVEPRAAWRARRVIRSALEGWQLGGLADDVVTCVSELVPTSTNMPPTQRLLSFFFCGYRAPF
jgi:hypothetical protein